VLRTALLFVRSAVRLVYAELPGPVAVCLPTQALCELGDRVLGDDRIVEHRRVQRVPPPPPLTAPPSHPRHDLPGPTNRQGLGSFSGKSLLPIGRRVESYWVGPIPGRVLAEPATQRIEDCQALSHQASGHLTEPVGAVEDRQVCP
jgi:hypothetical protein